MESRASPPPWSGRGASGRSRGGARTTARRSWCQSASRNRRSARRLAARAPASGLTDFLVKRDDLRECGVAESEAPALEPGQALLRVDTFGLTANNVTYAVMGEAMSYWKFFPAEDGWGRVPVWGFAEVERSEAEGVEAGTRLYGYLPP